MNCKEEEMWDSEQEAAIPEDYEYVPRGDHFITRTIKRLCGDDDSTVFVRMTKNGRYRRAKGYFAPGEIVAEAKRLKTETEEKRQVQREKAAAHR